LDTSDAGPKQLGPKCPLLLNKLLAPYKAMHAIFLAPAPCMSRVHNLDPSFWYQISWGQV